MTFRAGHARGRCLDGRRADVLTKRTYVDLLRTASAACRGAACAG